MIALLLRPTPERVKRIVARFGLTRPLQAVKWGLRPGLVGASLQGALLVGRIPLRRVRHLAYRRLGMQLAPAAVVHRGLEIRVPGQVTIGEGSVIGFDVILDGRRGITIGRHVNLSSQVAIWTLQHDLRDPDFGVLGGPVRVGDRAWLSFRATILPGVTIGEGAVVAAGAVVAHDVAPYAVVAGIPARVIGQRPHELAYELNAVPSPWFV